VPIFLRNSKWKLPVMPLLPENSTRRDFLATAGATLALAKTASAQPPGLDWQSQTPPGWAFNTRTELAAARVARVSSEAGAQAALVQARAPGQGFALRSGGHCFEGFSQHSQTVIDLGPLDHVEMLGPDRMRVGPGAMLGEVNAVTGPRGMMLPAGYCQTVGVGGHIGGGGIGLLGRPYGLACDHLLAARVLLADGTIVKASDDSHPDLFWALRGGGSGSFGIVTDFTFQLRPVSSAIHVEYFWEFTPEILAPIVSEWQRLTQFLPRAITSVMFLRALGNGLVQARMFLHSIEGEDTAIPAARMMHDIAPASIDPRITIASPHEIADTIWPRDYAPSHDTKIAANFQTRPSAPGRWLQVLTAMAQRDDQFLSINLDLKGGAIDDPPIAATAFPHRGTSIMTAQYELRFNDRRPRQAQLDWMRALQAITAVDANEMAYVNYPDLDLSDYATRYWGPNLPRLQAIKARYDPGNAFRHAQSVPLPN
jgi:FAD/FMN-containing dehydrogenase